MQLNALRGSFSEGHTSILDHVRICCSHGVPSAILVPVSSDDFNKFVSDVKVAACSTDGREFVAREPICFTTAAETCFLVTPDRLVHGEADVRAQKGVVLSILPQGFKPDSFLVVCVTPQLKQIEPTLEFIVYPDDGEAQRVRNPAYEPVNIGLYDRYTILRPVCEYISRLTNTACGRVVKARAALGAGDEDSYVYSARGRAQ